MICAAGYAQKMKIAHVTTLKIIDTIAQIDSINVRLQKDKDYIASTLKKKEQDYMAKKNEIEVNRGKWSDLQMKAEMEGLAYMEQDYGNFAQQAEQGLQEVQMGLLAPIQEEVQKAIDKVAEAQLVTYVIDNSQGILVHISKTNGAHDMTEDVIKEVFAARAAKKSGTAVTTPKTSTPK